MTFAVYQNIITNTTYAGRETGRPGERVPGQLLVGVISGVPEGTSRDEVIEKLFPFLAGFTIGRDAWLAAEAEWPLDLRTQVYSPDSDPTVTRWSWADLK